MTREKKQSYNKISNAKELLNYILKEKAERAFKSQQAKIRRDYARQQA